MKTVTDVTELRQLLGKPHPFTKQKIFDHLDEFQSENANAKQIDPANSLRLAIPLHEGAARYFEK